jgi:UPF0755 protein
MINNLARKIFSACLLLVFPAVIYIIFTINQAIYRPLKLPGSTHVVLVERGDTLTTVINGLAKEGIVCYPELLILFAKVKKKTGIRAGEYEIQIGINGESLLQKLASGQVIQYQVTFIEGSNLSENMKLLSGEKKLIDDISDVNDEEYRRVMGFLPSQAEGWFFPDTYAYVRGMKVSDVLHQAHNRMRIILDEEWQKKSKDLPYNNPYEALIMASIVEKETGIADERKRIAGVFVRRMKLGMKLQTDPTVIYGLGKSFTGDLNRSHLKDYSPWNTYVIDGLPPTPIAWPGRAAINAALNPALEKSLYFVAKGDGTHVFSESLAQHQQAVSQYQLRRKPNYHSTPSTITPSLQTASPQPAPGL